ncbi:MAG TPA: hypothetical protein VLF20_03635, partial [Patescibacteria group bacterium]|nr:hypothetical protein [Patescibacteria group bacterium]
MKNSKLSKFLLFSLAPSLLILFSFLYALYLVPTQIVFGFDQARDAYEAFSIYHNHDIKILGPSSDIVGVNHGVLWFYVLALVYFLGNSMPENAVYLLLVALYALVPVIGYFTYKMSKSAVVTWITLVLYVMSPLFLSFTHWLSNPLLALYITPPLLYLLWKYLHKPSALVAGGIGLLYALLIHSDFAYVVFVLLLPIYYFAYSLRFRMWDILSFGAGLLLGLTTFFLTYLKFQTNIVNIVFGFIFKSSSDGFSVGTTVFSFFDNVIRLLSFTYLPLPRLFIFILLVVLFIRFRKVFFTQVDRLLLFLLIWLSGFIFIFVLNHGTLLHSFFYGPFLYPLALLVALYL